MVEEDGREDKATIKCETSPPPTPRAIRMTHTLPSSYHNEARRYASPSTLQSLCSFSENIPPPFKYYQIDCFKKCKYFFFYLNCSSPLGYFPATSTQLGGRGRQIKTNFHPEIKFLVLK